MRIEHLLELVEPTLTRKNTNLRFRAGNDDDESALGQGNYSTVKNDRNDPHMVRKHHHMPIDDRVEDGYVDFVNYLIKNKIQGVNLPRIYDIKEITDRDGQKIYKYQLEKLLPVKEISFEELQSIINRTIDAEYETEDDVNEEGNKRHVLRQFGRDLEKCLIAGDYRRIKDEELINTLQTIKNYTITKKDAWLDMGNAGNLMFRRGPTGLQLVIADPFA